MNKSQTKQHTEQIHPKHNTNTNDKSTMKENDHINKCNFKIEKQIEHKMQTTTPAHRMPNTPKPKTKCNTNTTPTIMQNNMKEHENMFFFDAIAWALLGPAWALHFSRPKGLYNLFCRLMRSENEPRSTCSLRRTNFSEPEQRLHCSLKMHRELNAL